MSVSFINTTFSAAQATTGAYLFGTFTGSNVLSGVTPVTINGEINLPNSVVQVDLNIGGVTTAGAAGTYLGYSSVPNSTDYVYYFQVTAASLATPVVIGVTGAPSLPLLQLGTPVITASVTAPVGSIACYAEGTLIRTVRGDVAIEDLAVGDEIVTASGEHRPIKWLGHRTLSVASHPTPERVQPIRIRANAIAPGMPARDLRISPDHALFLDNVLVQGRFLVNGSTIVRDTVDEITYWHLELDSHDVLIAENLPSETYLDVGNRQSFEGGAAMTLHADFEGEAVDGHCAPMVIGGERLSMIRRWLAERARHLGARTTADPALQLFADGMVVTPVAVGEGRYVYALPAAVESLRIVSRTAVPAEMLPDATDTRTLGVCITELQLDGATVALDDPCLADGWSETEGAMRWTTGDAALPVARSIVIQAKGLEAYPVGAPRLCGTVAAAAPALRRAG